MKSVNTAINVAPDQVRRFILENQPVRGYWVDLAGAWQELRAHQHYTPAVQNLLGEAVSASVLLAATLKFQGTLTLQLEGKGDVRLLVAQCSNDFKVRAVARLSEEAAAAEESAAASAASGEGATVATDGGMLGEGATFASDGGMPSAGAAAASGGGTPSEGATAASDGGMPGNGAAPVTDGGMPSADPTVASDSGTPDKGASALSGRRSPSQGPAAEGSGAESKDRPASTSSGKARELAGVFDFGSRADASNPFAIFPNVADALSAASFRQLVGENGRVIVTIEGGDNGMRYQGIVPLDGDSLAECLESYFASSEQLPTRLRLAANGDRSVGLLLQKLPEPGGADLEEGSPSALAWQDAERGIAAIRPADLVGASLQSLLEERFGQRDVRVFKGMTVEFACRCSQARVAGLLRSLGADEVRDVLREQGAVEVTCEFCQRPYKFDAFAVEQLFAPDATPGVGQSVH